MKNLKALTKDRHYKFKRNGTEYVMKVANVTLPLIIMDLFYFDTGLKVSDGNEIKDVTKAARQFYEEDVLAPERKKSWDEHEHSN